MKKQWPAGLTAEEIAEFLKDVRQVAIYLQWQSKPGDELALKLMKKIHNGYYGSGSGIWVQADEIINEVHKRLRKTKD